ncbi:hypothetical protein ACN42_g10068 [Penicillium freii]|uniref:Uncharacterized protein n=1 Tax=Penicillium freii TaxID=48697 RepID=A0A101MAQ2_PENFR|nr:hypothetical protein ACN42_g10068 [Penicillium freii]
MGREKVCISGTSASRTRADKEKYLLADVRHADDERHIDLDLDGRDEDGVRSLIDGVVNDQKDIIRPHKRPTILVIIKSKVAYYHPYPNKRNATATQSRCEYRKT